MWHFKITSVPVILGINDKRIHKLINKILSYTHDDFSHNSNTIHIQTQNTGGLCRFRYERFIDSCLRSMATRGERHNS